MKLRRKIALMALMGVGVFGAVITSYKAYQLRNLPGHDNLTGKLPLSCNKATCVVLFELLL